MKTVTIKEQGRQKKAFKKIKTQKDGYEDKKF